LKLWRLSSSPLFPPCIETCCTDSPHLIPPRSSGFFPPSHSYCLIHDNLALLPSSKAIGPNPAPQSFVSSSALSSPFFVRPDLELFSPLFPSHPPEQPPPPFSPPPMVVLLLFLFGIFFEFPHWSFFVKVKRRRPRARPAESESFRR